MTRKKVFLSVFAISLSLLSGCNSTCDHSSIVVDEAVAPTCVKHGLTEGSHCELCNQVIVKQEIIEPLGHSTVIDNQIDATCTRDGLTAGIHCDRCNTIIVAQNVIEHMNHTIVSDLPVTATCTTYGLTEGSRCETCNEVIVKQEIIEPLGHDVVIDEEISATCEENGLTAGAHCARCNKELVAREVIGHFGHTIVIDEEIEATCEGHGLTAGAHCETCGMIIVSQELTEPLGHDMVIDPAIEATCEEAGSTESAHCNRCNMVSTSRVRVPPTGHDIVIDSLVMPTCTGHGLTEGAHCATCGKVLVEQHIIDPLGHDVVIDEEVEPTCTEDGLAAGAHCSRCNEVLVPQEIIGHNGHAIIKDEAVSPTCTTNGLTEGSHCATCGEILVKQEIVQALMHDVAIDVAREPTCVEDGATAGAHCSRCNETLVAQDKIDALGHVVIEDHGYDATCTENGLTDGSHCERCGEVLTPQEVIEAHGHNEVIDHAVEPTCENDGLTEGSHCHTCGEVITPQNVVEHTGHNYDYNNARFNWTNRDYESSATATVNCLNDADHSLNLQAEMNRQLHSPTIDSNGYIENTATIRDEFGVEYSDTNMVEIDQYTSDAARHCEHHWIRASSNYYSLICDKCLEKSLPIININTEEQFTKEYVNTSVSVEAGNDEYNINNAACQVKIRGNGTSEYDKKPYRLKFSTKQKMLGLNNNLKAKSWVLLAEHNGLMQKTMLGLMLSKSILGEEYYSSDFTFVNLYINDHYHGVYLLAEQQQVNEGRININEPKKNYDGTDIGYLVEMDEYCWGEENYFFMGGYRDYDMSTSSGEAILNDNLQTRYTVKSDIYSQEQNAFIKKAIENIFAILYDSLHEDHFDLISNPYKTLDSNFDIICDNSITSAKQAIENVVDFESLIRMFLLQEIVQDYDIGWSSFYMYIDCSETGNKKLTFVAPWDFDLGLGWTYSAYEDQLYLFSKADPWYELYNPWFMVFATSDWFFDELKTKWNSSNYNFQSIITYANSLAVENLPVIFRDYLLWPRDIFGQYKLEGFRNHYLKEANDIYEYINTKVNNLNSIFADQSEEVPLGYIMDFQVNNGTKIFVYEGKDYTVPGVETLSTIVEDMSGDAQLNFKVMPAEGYEIDSIIVTGSYKNLKGPADTGAENVYRLTKVASDLIITVNTRPLAL